MTPEILGWISTILLGFCGIPQAIKVWKTKSAKDISWIFVIMWFFGEVFAFTYVCMTGIIEGVWQTPLLANYMLNICITGFLLLNKTTDQIGV